MSDALPFAMPDIGAAEIAAVTEVLRSRWLTTGARCHDFEREFALAVGAAHAVAVNSCTAAMHLSLEALGVQDGDLVFVSPYTFAATGEVIRYLGARPIFVDVDPETLNIDPRKLRTTVETYADGHAGRPRAVMPVHIAGLPCAMDEIWEIAREHELLVVEDAAHAFPSAHNNIPVGSMPNDIHGTACFSFYATKTITTGEGGMLVTQSADVADRARSMSLHGLSHSAWNRYTAKGSWAYDIAAPGYKYNMTDVAAALGIVQLRRAEGMLLRRAAIADAYNEAFQGDPRLTLPATRPDTRHAWHLYVLRLNLDLCSVTRSELISELSNRGIGSSVHFIPLHMHSYYATTYGYEPNDFPTAASEYERAVSLPIYSAMSDEDVARVIHAIYDILDR